MVAHMTNTHIANCRVCGYLLYGYSPRGIDQPTGPGMYVPIHEHATITGWVATDATPVAKRKATAF
jgi:hypothetical protein